MFDLNQCYSSLATEPDAAYFWSGLGPHGADIAAEIAQANGGTTLEMLMEKNKENLISAGFEYDYSENRFPFSPENKNDWKLISQAFAEQASGEVHAVLGENVRECSVWNTKEFPALSENENVNKITAVDPTTGQDTKVLLDKSVSSSEDTTQPFNPADYIPKTTHVESSGISFGAGIE